MLKKKRWMKWEQTIKIQKNTKKEKTEYAKYYKNVERGE